MTNDIYKYIDKFFNTYLISEISASKDTITNYKDTFKGLSGIIVPGGFGDRAKKRHAYIVYQNGTIVKAKKGKIEPGCEVVVPSKARRDNLSLGQWLGIGTSAASLATMFATIANLIK